MKLTVRFPTAQEEEQTNRFRTYYNYVCVIGSYIDQNEKDFLKDVISSASFKGIQGGHSYDIKKVEKLLRNAWMTEIQLNMSGKQKEFSVYANHWAPVQSYYAVYLMIRTLFTVMGRNDLGGEHASNLKAIAEEIKRRPDLFPFPWKILCEGNPSAPTYCNLPDGTKVTKVSPLLNHARTSVWDSMGLLLKTTRQRKLEKICDDWKHQEKRKRIDLKIRDKFTQNLSVTSFFHFLYRLRLRSNYEDADSFLLSLQTDTEADAFNGALRKINSSTLLILELLIVRYLGKKVFKGIVDSFSSNLKSELEIPVLKRWEAINGAF